MIAVCGLSLLLMLVVAGICLYTRSKFKYWQKRGVASLNPLTPAGDFLLSLTWRKNEHLLLADCYKAFRKMGVKFGGLYYTYGPVFVPVDTDIIKKVLQTDYEYFSDRGTYHNKAEQPLSEHLFSMEGDKWRSLRAKLTPCFSAVKMRTMFNAITNISQGLVEVIKKSDGAAVNTTDLFRRYSIDITAHCFYGIEERNVLSDKRSVLLDLGVKITRCSVIDVLKVAWSEGTKNPGNIAKLLYMDLKIYNFFKNFVSNIVESRAKNKEQRKDYIDCLLEIMNEKRSELDPLNPFDFDDVVSQVVLLFTASFETSAFVLFCSLYELANHPHIQERLRQEITTAMEENNNEISYSMISDLKYLNQVIEEVIRLHNVSPTLNRICVKDYKIPGTNVTIEKGTPVVISTLGMHHDPVNFPNPKTFDPDRFADKYNMPYALGFGAGPKQCIGKRVAEMKMKVALMRILSNFRVTVNEKTGPRLILEDVAQHIVLQYKNTFWMNFEQLH